ncbi:cyclin-domain-containing protein, partial [Agrocybe pediades]
MLAVVQPFSPSPDVAHRVRSNVSPSNPTTTRPSASTILASNPPPSLQRHQTAPATLPTRKQASPKLPVTSTDPSLSSSVSSTSSSTSSSTTTSGTETEKPAFDIHSYPATDLLKLLALLLTHIATTNDRLSPSQPAPPPPAEAPPIWHTLTTASRNAISTPAATLTFHARNVPTISLEAYLLRILKYCPTTNHVFLSLLVYFERMSKLSNDAVGRAFVIDSYNIHRLVIAGVTVASKFFSDVFYTNSRYAKVGGLPLPELNQLELQFLLLNDFRLVISSSEMQHY